MRRRLVLIAAAWSAALGFVAGTAQAQSSTSPGGQFSVVGVVLLENGRALAWVQEPRLTENKVVTVRVGDNVGPYRVTKILTHLVELTGPGGTISVPLAGAPGAVGVASSSGASSPRAAQRPAGEMPPHPALNNPHAIVALPGDPSRNFPASKLLVGAGATVGPVGGQAPAPQAPSQRPVSPQDVPVPAAKRTPPPELPPTGALNNPHAIVAPRGDPSRVFPASKLLVGAGAVITGGK